MIMITVFDPIYFQPDATEMLSTRKQIEVVRVAHRRGLISRITRPRAATPEQVAKVHDLRYVEAVATGQPRHVAESQGFHWSQGFAESLFTIFGGQVLACRLALKHGLVFHAASGAHHARRDSGAAFCSFNFLVGGPLPLLEKGIIQRVLIIDLDEHQGNGTHSLVSNDRRFAQFDVSGCNFGVGELDAPRTCFKVVATKSHYFHALERLPKMIEQFEPDLIEYQAGMDAFDDDGGPRGMDEAALRLRDRIVFEEVYVRRGIPCVWNLAGGYIPVTTVALHLGTVCEAVAAEGRRARAQGVSGPARRE
jgi:acetoin utilization deacetylase AcuC-like enzyme